MGTVREVFISLVVGLVYSVVLIGGATLAGLLGYGLIQFVIYLLGLIPETIRPLAFMAVVAWIALSGITFMDRRRKRANG